MKSSRSTSANNIRRNARRILIESSSDDSDSSVVCDSARAEKVFSRRRPILNTTVSSINESIKFESNKTLFRISTSSSDASLRNLKDENEVEELKDTSIHSLTTDTDDMNFQTYRKHKNMHKFVLDSSDESDIEQGIQLKSDSESTDIINSSNEMFTIPNKVNCEKSEIENKLKELSIIEQSDSDNDTDISAHYKSTITSSNKNNLLFNDSKLYNPELIPLCQSSILENSDFEEMDNLSNKTNDEVIILDDDSSISNHSNIECSQKHTNKITNLTEINSNEKSLTLPQGLNNSKKITSNDFKLLKMEKIRLGEIITQLTKNIDTMKNTMKITNLNLLPDGGIKLKKAILKEDNALKDANAQLKNVISKLEYFEEESEISSPRSHIKLLNNYNNGALTTKAAANIDIKAMGDKALSTYRAQQALTLDVLHELHKSLETCPCMSILANDPPGLKVTLMPHQKYALEWLSWRERQNPRGGVLADDMGLGKTLTMISLILKSMESKMENDDSDSDSDSDDKLRNNNAKTIKGGTLIICPPSLIDQWANEIKQKLRPRILNVTQHYGAGRNASPRKLARNDVVITTYHVVMWDHKGRQRNDSPLFQIKWDRIILDEAHIIRNFKSQTSIAVSELCGIKRWVLTGTPVHNKETDFYALLKFIKCKPFDDLAVWKRWVGNNDEAGKNRLSLIVKTLMLRRTKNELSDTDTFKLPPKNVHTFDVELLKEEKEVYEKVLLFSSSLFASYLYEKAEKENAIEHGFPYKNKVKYLHQQNLKDDVFQDHPELDKLFKQYKNNSDIKAHHILVLILRLRQLCCHPFLMKNLLEDESLKIDGIPTEDIKLIDNMSRMSIGVPIDEKEIPDRNSIFSDSWVSSKIKAVCDAVKDKVLNTDDKAVIVSQWPSMLILVNKQLSKYQVKTEMFSGSVPVYQRNKIINDFNNCKGGPKILLLSLTAGGVGLNLVVANHIFLIDIHWNPQLEAQACDRVYRIGQMKPVNVYKFICTNTIEQKIQGIQSRKLEIADRLFGGRSDERTKITLNDLKDIFNVNSNVK